MVLLTPTMRSLENAPVIKNIIFAASQFSLLVSNWLHKSWAAEGEKCCSVTWYNLHPYLPIH